MRFELAKSALPLVLALSIATTSLVGAAPVEPRGTQAPITAATVDVTISSVEADGLRFMIEEEKMARDVYLKLSEQWGSRVFSNIAKSEQKHMDSVAHVMEQFGVPNPVLPENGKFANQEIQALYDQLIAEGSRSLQDAYKVGVVIEETDIADLQERIDATDNSTIQRLYTNLLRGSHNHLIAFERNIDRSGAALGSAPQTNADNGNAATATRRGAGWRR